MKAITKPTLIVNKSICQSNIRTMANKAKNSGVVFRPHFKTHQSAEIGEHFKAYGIYKITVSSIDMAVEFASQGWNDITIAFPLNVLEIETINDLANRITVNIVVESIDALVFLKKNLSFLVNVLIKIDAGYRRTGIQVADIDYISLVVEAILKTDNLNFSGFLAHFGNTYNTQSKQEIIDIYRNSIDELKKLQINFPEAIVSIGDTPSCSVIDTFDEVGEIRPGNFVYYDAMQWKLGACSLNQVAAIMACPVVSMHAERNEIVIHGGAVHFSKETLINKSTNESCYGFVVQKDQNDHIEFVPNVFVKKLSQELGIISAPKEYISSIHLGDILFIIPIHSCLTANLMKHNILFVDSF
ncbi:MAG: alanine racemase [Salinivirgaceae bacterium]|jgi:D-serine deaminase-like pyridoxal phosphate-dependent protein|nr:alanine racemase [Salinivirgaceae bacterium]